MTEYMGEQIMKRERQRQKVSLQERIWQGEERRVEG